MQVARAKAKSTGKSVTVDELTTPISLTVANPDGTLTRTDHQQPARVKKNGTWTPVDATLAKNPDGTYAPKATPSGVVLSGGGTGPLATFTDSQGRSLALTFPFRLPAPTVSGDNASYESVLPGVDLKATVTDQGAFREVLVVRDATAAANPVLKSLRLATTTNGLTVTADQAGNITAKASDGTAAFTTPTPVMWDSTVATAPTAGVAKSLSAPAPVAPAARAADSVGITIDASDTAVSSEKGPGRDARVSSVAVSADSAGLTLTPDAGQLTSPTTTWPVYIDPYVSPATGSTNHYTEVKEGCPGDKLYDQPQTNGQGIGYQHYDECFGLYRSFYEIDTKYLDSRMVVSNSTLYFTETYGADNGCSNTWPVTLKLMDPINKDTVWPGPREVSTIRTQTVKSAAFAGRCDPVPVLFDVTSTIRNYLDNDALTFGLFGNESKYDTNYGFMRFGTNPYIKTTYDIAPKAPSGMNTTPATQNPAEAACGAGTPGWIGMTSLNGNTSNITLDATLTTEMQGVSLKAGYHVWDNMTSNGAGSPADVSWPVSPGDAATGTLVRTNIGAQVRDGHQYGWNVWATDGTLSGPSSAYCYFNVDLSPPTLAAFTASATFPPLGSGTPTTAHAGEAAAVSVSSTDPVPGSCAPNPCISSGVQAFQYALDTNIPVSGASTVNATLVNGKPTATIPITVPNNQWGTHTLYVRAIDNAGNTQATAATYSFYAPWNPNAKVTAGDLTGDGIPDMLATTTDGNLTLIGGNSDPSSTPVTASTSARSPRRDGWNNYLIAHRGGLSQQGIDDLFAYNKALRLMYIYNNDAAAVPAGAAGHFSLTENVQGPLEHRACQTSNGPLTCSGQPSDWSQLTQLVAPGTISASLYNATHPAKRALAPDMITVESGKLWYYIGGDDPNTYFRDVRPIGSGDWTNTTLVGVGNVGATVTGTAPTATTTGGTPTLWVRNNVTGAISSYPLTFDNDGNPTSVITAPTQASLVSGITGTSGQSLCLDIAGSATTNGTPAQIWNCNSTDAQRFTLGTDNTVHVLGKCLEARGTGNDAPVQLWDCNNSSSQQWIPGPQPGTLKNLQSGRCVDDPGSNPAPGTKLVIYDCSGSGNQNWAGTSGGALPAPQSVLPLGLNSTTYPAISTPGDVNGDGNPEIYAIAANGQIVSNPGAGPADRWKLTDNTNAARAANTLTPNGGATVTADATRGNVLTGNGATAYAASVNPSVDTGKSFTVSAWTKLSSLDNNSTFVSQSGTSANGLQLYYSSWKHAFAFGHPWADDTTGNQTAAYGPTTGNAAPTMGTWYHLTGVYDAASKQLTLYVNGTKAGTATYAGTTWNATGPIQIGRRLLGTNSYGDYLAGSVSDVQTYPTALTDVTVVTAMSNIAQFSPATTLGYLLTQPADRWKLADKTDSIRPNDLTLAGHSGWPNDATRGLVLGLDGTPGARASTAGPVINTTQSYTVSAWAYLTNTNGFATVVGQSGNSTSAFFLQYSAAFKSWTFTTPSVDDANLATYAAAYDPTLPALNTWTHLVGVYDATNQTISLYVNGTLVSTASNISTWPAGGPLTIGNAKVENPFPGKISDVQTWNTAFPAATVAALKAGTQPTPVQLS
ncbi:hypothetical protein F4556_001365 [Kitasatospora gansuensis]|uniref:Ricin-type beta-trefoil lectin protein n=1 Tax=Kitasatospora gansuensis TaxID=258050 RepID=A0A7W7S8H1_9ACTN|nr:LamG-like jellyroll fold domain-containing protein [Kitasatospora gansuensis]MBB4945830.1 hypothetical protein [Kitasatospora gansuensis]